MRVNSFGERLKLARRRSNLSLRALAHKIQSRVSAQAIGKYERGEMMPGTRVLDVLSKALGVSNHFLMSAQVLELRDLEFRRETRASPADLAVVELAIIDHVQRYCSIERILQDVSLTWRGSRNNRLFIGFIGEAEFLAMELRKRWHLGDDPIPNMTELLEVLGFKVLLTSLPEHISGVACSVRHANDNSPITVIAVNSRHSLELRRLTLARELGHCLFDPISPVNHEKAAEEFAGAFLVTRSHLESQIGTRRNALSYDELVQLKRMYGISAVALLSCLNRYGIIEDKTLKYAHGSYARRWKDEEPDPLEPIELAGQLEKPQRFERLCYQALVERYISIAKAMELLRLPLHRIEQSLTGPLSGDANPNV